MSISELLKYSQNWIDTKIKESITSTFGEVPMD